MYCCIWIVIPQFEHSSYLSAPMVLFAAAWVVLAYQRHGAPKKSTYLQVGYALAIVLSALISAMHIAGGVLLLITFLVYEFMVPQLPGILLEVEANSNEIDNMAKEGD